ncbi:hypothetical protein BGZ47_007985 [Haplosporangium gracile]|nr:hypothetical protein BGZ47_007985 [Haplosporangium gracile]
MRTVGDYKNATQVQKYTDTTSVIFQIILGNEDVATKAQPLTPQDISQNHLWTCIKAVNTNLMHITTHYFVQAIFKEPESQVYYCDHRQHYLLATRKIFSTLLWRDQETRDGAIKKLKVITKSVGFSIDDPDDTSSESLKTYYKNYTVADDDYFINQVRYSLLVNRQNLFPAPFAL